MDNNIVMLFAACMAIVCIVLMLLVVALFFLFLRERKKSKGLRGEAERQRERVEVRRKKILELREEITGLQNTTEDQEAMLRESRSLEELRTHYGRMTDALVRIYQEVNTQPMERGRQERIVKDIVRLSNLMSATFDMKNEVALPWMQDQRKKQNQSVEKKPAHSGARILLVDDNRNSCAQLTDVLEINGFWVEKADSGEEALKKFAQSRDGYFSLVFMDIVLSGISGYETAREIRRMYRDDSERIPIIALTANNFSEDMIQIQKAGMNDRIVKPLTEDRLMAVVKKWLGEGAKAGMKADRESGREVRSKISEAWKTLSMDEPNIVNLAEEQYPAVGSK